MFWTLVKIKWQNLKNSFSGQQLEAPTEQHDVSYACFISFVGRRLLRLDLYDCLFNDVEKHKRSEEETLKMIQELEEAAAQAKEQFGSSYNMLPSASWDPKMWLRSGKGWAELRDLVGAEEVVLLGNPLLEKHKFLLQLDIPRVIEEGTEDEFLCLKSVLPSRCAWLIQTCHNLKGLLELLMLLTEANSD
jgi:hypothetical protein